MTIARSTPTISEDNVEVWNGRITLRVKVAAGSDRDRPTLRTLGPPLRLCADDGRMPTGRMPRSLSEARGVGGERCHQNPGSGS
jgi:hypothetical protein